MAFLIRERGRKMIIDTNELKKEIEEYTEKSLDICNTKKEKEKCIIRKDNMLTALLLLKNIKKRLDTFNKEIKELDEKYKL